MGEMRGEINIGQLCRERFAELAVLIGFGTDRGTVAAASEWDRPMEIKQVRPAHHDSSERLCRESASRASWWICGNGTLLSCAASCFIPDWNGRSA
jgi:erythromycin esterase-like protein